MTPEEKNQQDLHSEKELDETFKRCLKDVGWPILFGTVKVQIRNGEPTLATIERTVKLD